jgi:hypothetical protein
VGLGNIAGVAFAVGIGGPGAVFWMILAGFLGMSSKFAECTLGQRYRVTRADGHVSGGAMPYLKDGLAELGLARLGGVLAPLFALMCIGGSFGGGNMYQSNQAYTQVASVLPFLDNTLGAIAFGLLLAFFVGLVIIGGIKRIGEVAATIVPFMCTLYVLCGLWILLTHAGSLGHGLATIVTSAFSWEAGAGGFVGVLIQGFRRAAFSNEAGTGSAAIAGVGGHRPLRGAHRRARARGHGGAARALRGHGHRLCDDGPRPRGDRRLRGPERRRGHQDDLRRLRHGLPLVPARPLLHRRALRLQHDDLLELLRRAVLGEALRPRLAPALQGDLPDLHLDPLSSPGPAPSSRPPPWSTSAT